MASAVGEAEHGLAAFNDSPSSDIAALPTHTTPGTCCLKCLPDSSAWNLSLTPLSPQQRNTLGVSRGNSHSCQDPQTHIDNLCTSNQTHVFQTLLSKQCCPSCPSHHCPESWIVSHYALILFENTQVRLLERVELKRFDFLQKFWFDLSSQTLQCLPVISTKLQTAENVEAPGLEFPRNFECAEWFRSLTPAISEERLLSNYTGLIPAAKKFICFFHVFF